MADNEVEASSSRYGAPQEDVDVPLLGDADGNDALVKANTLSTVVIYFMTIHFLLAFCEMVLVAPIIKLFEDSLCLTYYNFPNSGVEESQCKNLEIQRSLATIRGWKSLFDTLPGAFLII
jgi:hypothetical protein